MLDYMSFCEEEEYEAEEVGAVPSSYADAIRLLDRFVAEAEEAVKGALTSSEFLFQAIEISVRAQTFASLLQSKKERGPVGP
jgi:hypothetical protein